jgi:hypothetical protein
MFEWGTRVAEVMEEDLTKLWGNFTLTEEESVGFEAKEEVFEEAIVQGQSCIVGKLLVERVVGKESIRSTLIRWWKPKDYLSFKVMGENLFLIEFTNPCDKIRVLEGRPWIFEGNLFSVADFDGSIPANEVNFNSESFWIKMFNLPLGGMCREMGVQLGATVGEVEEVDTNENGVSWGKYMRVKIKINITKPLARGRMLKMKGRSYWIKFQYEKIPKFCYRCGVIWHGNDGCRMREKGRTNNDNA